MEPKFYFCPICGNVILKMVDSGQVPTCCGEEMNLLIPNTMDDAKHLPFVVRVDVSTVKVSVGAQLHPSLVNHHIVFLYIETDNGGVIHYLEPLQEPTATFRCVGNLIAVYAYCNLHGLWKTDVINL